MLAVRFNARLGGAVSEGTAAADRPGLPRAKAGMRESRANRLAPVQAGGSSADSERCRAPSGKARRCEATESGARAGDGSVQGVRELKRARCAPAEACSGPGHLGDFKLYA